MGLPFAFGRLRVLCLAEGTAMQTRGTEGKVQPDFVDHLRERLGMTRSEAERMLGDWLANYRRVASSDEKRTPAAGT